MATDSSPRILERLALVVATGFGTGYLPLAPGTWGSLVGVLYFLALWKMNCVALGALAGLAFSLPAASVGERRFGRKDPGEVVVDEVACFPLAMLGLPVTAGWLVAAFVLYRALDVVKPPPARRVQRWPSGWGVVADDVVAGLYTCGILHGVRWAAGLLGA